MKLLKTQLNNANIYFFSTTRSVGFKLNQKIKTYFNENSTKNNVPILISRIHIIVPHVYVHANSFTPMIKQNLEVLVFLVS